MKAFQSKIILLLVIGLSVLQLFLMGLMMNENHKNVCAFDEHCILQSVLSPKEAAPHLLAIVLPVILFFAVSFHFEKPQLAKSPIDHSLRRTFRGIIQRE